MEQQLIKLLDKDLKCIEFKIKDKQMILEVQSEKKKVSVPIAEVLQQGYIPDMNGRSRISRFRISRRSFC